MTSGPGLLPSVALLRGGLLGVVVFALEERPALTTPGSIGYAYINVTGERTSCACTDCAFSLRPAPTIPFVLLLVCVTPTV